MTAVTLSSKFQVSIPRDIRDGLMLRPGQKLVFLHTGSAIKLAPQPAIDDLIGVARVTRTNNVRDRSDGRRRLLPSPATAGAQARRLRR